MCTFSCFNNSKKQIDDLVQKLQQSITSAMNQVESEGLWSKSNNE